MSQAVARVDPYDAEDALVAVHQLLQTYDGPWEAIRCLDIGQTVGAAVDTFQQPGVLAAIERIRDELQTLGGAVGLSASHHRSEFGPPPQLVLPASTTLTESRDATRLQVDENMNGASDVHDLGSLGQRPDPLQDPARATTIVSSIANLAATTTTADRHHVDDSEIAAPMTPSPAPGVNSVAPRTLKLRSVPRSDRSVGGATTRSSKRQRKR